MTAAPPVQADTKAPLEAAAAGKYLTFTLGQESYAVQVLKVREIIRLVDVTHVPRMPEYIRGVINLRGKIVPVIDLRIKFELSHRDISERTCIIVVQVDLPSGVKSQMGLMVDAVEEVVQIAAQDIEETPDFGSKLDTEYILGMAKIKDGVKTLLDIDRVLTAETLNRLKNLS